MPRIIMNRAFIARWTRMPHSTGRLSASASSQHSLSSAAFITNIAESDFRHAQALRRSDTFFAFVLRSVRRVLADHSLTDPQVITSLWSIFDDPDLNGALDIPQKSPMAIVPRKSKQAR